MGLDNGKLTLPMNTVDISKCLRHWSYDLGTLCAAKKYINIWSEHKPVKHTKPSYLLQSEFESKGFGIIADHWDISTPSYMLSMFNSAMSGDTKWDYDCLEVDTTTDMIKDGYRARIYDFDGYINYAVCPLLSERQGTDYTFDISLWQDNNLPEGNITMTHLTKILGFDNTNNCGYGLLYRLKGATTASDIVHINAFDGNGNLKYPLSINGEPSEVTIQTQVSVTSEKEYEVVPYLVKKGDPNNVFIHPAGALTVTVKVKPSAFEIIDFYATASSETAKWSYTFTIVPNSTLSAATATVKIYKADMTGYESINHSIPALTASSANHVVTQSNIEVLQPYQVGNIELSYQGATAITQIDIEDGGDVG